MSNAYNVCDRIKILPGGREELVEEITADFPCAAFRSEHDLYLDHMVNWHWHQEIELFCSMSGKVLYRTPHESVVVEPGTIGFINANVLHTTLAYEDTPHSDLSLYLFRPSFIADSESRIYKEYVEPLISATSIEMLTLESTEENKKLCNALKRSFKTYEQGKPGWELRLRNQISEIWFSLFERVEPLIAGGPMLMPRAADERLKTMMNFVSQHYFEHIGVPEIAESAFTSERDCYRTFSEALNISPAQYLRDYRVQQACRLLVNTTRPVAQVGEQTGLGSPSHFGQVFKESVGTTPTAYRKRWQKYESVGV